MKVYIAFPYGRRRGLTEKQCETNVLKSIEVARQVIQMGHNPFLPNLYHYVHKGWVETLEEDEWAKITAEWIEDCDVLLFLGNEQSIGCQREKDIARFLGKPIIWKVEELP